MGQEGSAMVGEHLQKIGERANEVAKHQIVKMKKNGFVSKSFHKPLRH